MSFGRMVTLQEKSMQREVMAQDKPERQLTLSEVMRLGFVLPKQTEKPYTSFPPLISTTVIRREGVTKFQ